MSKKTQLAAVKRYFNKGDELHVGLVEMIDGQCFLVVEPKSLSGIMNEEEFSIHVDDFGQGVVSFNKLERTFELEEGASAYPAIICNGEIAVVFSGNPLQLAPGDSVTLRLDEILKFLND